MKKSLLTLMLIIVSIIAVACGSEEDQSNQESSEASSGSSSNQTTEEQLVSEEEKVKNDKTVATINGTEINGVAYNQMYSTVKSTLQQSGQDTEDTDSLKEQTLTELINQELIRQDAVEQGIKVDDEQIQSQVDSLKDQYGDQFSTVLKSSGLTEETYKKQLKQNALSTKYMKSEFDIKVSDEEIQQYYDSLKEQSEKEIPALEQVKGRIEQMLFSQKQQEKKDQIQAKIDELKSNAKIEKLI
ncbi:SurA N-terminal domain-containing protein [Gracilibacillus caseinilyticus]|uniref:SurA N-terminal domain-containing protein n=1 Tax=Gracilibacillus caseinilyticus TaxID=2932256 RepID=A0ABY4EXG4_9BACI|nr:SurA N-terminal domain-containing protein [Gracilibacillus caseinilyticus]UOQ48542.1 SurA N-terminal domain-containing protein [Gracilibacillus caseinilyticus]